MTKAKKTKETQTENGSDHREFTQRQVERDIAMKLTESDLANQAQMAAQIDQEIQELEHEMDGIKKDFNGKISAKQRELSQILRIVRKGEHLQRVAGTEVLDYVGCTVSFWIEGHKVEERIMTAEERQREMFTETQTLDADPDAGAIGPEAS